MTAPMFGLSRMPLSSKASVTDFGSMSGRTKRHVTAEISCWCLKAPTKRSPISEVMSLMPIPFMAAYMNQSDGPATARVSAAQALLDRGWGKAAQPIAGEEGGLAVIARIERVIVDSQKASAKKHSSGEDGRPHTED